MSIKPRKPEPKRKQDPETGPAPAQNPQHDPNAGCEPTPGKKGAGRSQDKPDCPEGYADRQPDEPPQQRGR